MAAGIAGATVLVTGGNTGLGKETAVELARMGAHVTFTARDRDRGAAAHAEIVERSGRDDVEVLHLDLGDLDDVKRAAAAFTARHDRLDVLVLNAGAQLRKRERTSEGVDVMLATNHIGPFLLTQELLPLLQRSAPARIVVVASDAHKFSKLHLDDLHAERGYGILGMPRYGETKLMNILFTRELARRLEGTGVTVNAVHPGAVATNLGNPPAFLRPIVDRILKTPAQGAATSITVATDPALADTSGAYFANSKRADQKLNKHARDDADAAALWDASVAICN